LSRPEADLILHPVRYRILQTLLGRELNTQQIAKEIPSTPISSLYRHLKTLLEAGLVQVVETNLINGIEEKIYTVGEVPSVSKEDFSQYTSEEHRRFFAAYLSSLLRGFSDYLSSREKIDLDEERVGFTDAVFYATTQELDRVGEVLMKSLEPLRKNKPSENRQRQMFSIITFPIEKKE
jgi:DNA-binding transcriptional ArsR family regulator